MIRTLSALAAGIAIGAVAAYLALPHAPVPPPAADASAEARLAGAAAEPGPGAVTTAEASSWYRLASASGARELRGLIRDTARDPASDNRRFALDVLFGRLAEIDAGAAITALALVADPADAAGVALGVLTRVGFGEANVARVLRAAPALDPPAFRLAAARAAADASPAAAIEIARRIEDAAVRSRALHAAAQSWARSDPRAALARGQGLVPPEHAAQFRDAVLETWSREAPEALLDYLGEGALSPQELQKHALRAVSSALDTEPARIIELAETWPEPLAGSARHLAMQRWAQESPSEALAYLETLRPGVARESLQTAYAAGYARVDPEGALAWARQSGLRRPGLLHQVLAGLAAEDPMRALDLVLSSDAAGLDAALVPSIVSTALAVGGELDDALARRILDIPDEQTRQRAVQSLTSAWAARDAHAALDWVLTHADRVGAAAIAQVAHRFANRDPDAAAGYVQRVPAEARDAWIGAVAQAYARHDPQRAMSWIGQYRGDPAYDRAAAAVISQTARYDPVGAAGLLDTLGADSPSRPGLVSMVAGQWARQDRYAARSWTLNQPRGPARDSALSALLQATPDPGRPDPALLDAFSDAGARQRALVNLATRLAQSDRDAARALVDEHVTDPRLREQAERFLSSTPFGRMGVQLDSLVMPANGVPVTVPMR